MLIDVGRLVVRSTLWFLRRRREKMPIAQVIEIFRPGLVALRELLPGILAPADRVAFEASVQRLTSEGVPADLADRYAELEGLYAVLDATEVAVEQKKAIELVGALYFALVGELDLRWISAKITQLPTDTSWQAIARNVPLHAIPRLPPTLASAVANAPACTNQVAPIGCPCTEQYGAPVTRRYDVGVGLEMSPTVD